MRCLVVAIAFGVALGTALTTASAQAPPVPPQAQTPPAQPQAKTPPPATAPARPFPEGSRIAFIDAQRILSTSALGKASMARMSTLRAQKLAELTARNKELETAQQKLAGGSLLSQDASMAAQKTIDRLQVEIQRAQQDADAALQELQQQLNVEFDRALAPIVAQVATDKGIHILLRLDTGAIAWADPALDLTGEIVRRLDAAKPASASKPPIDPR